GLVNRAERDRVPDHFERPGRGRNHPGEALHEPAPAGATSPNHRADPTPLTMPRATAPRADPGEARPHRDRPELRGHAAAPAGGACTDTPRSASTPAQRLLMLIASSTGGMAKPLPTEVGAHDGRATSCPAARSSRPRRGRRSPW